MRSALLIALVALGAAMAGCAAPPPVDILGSSADVAIHLPDDVRIVVHRGVPSPPTFVNISIENGGRDFGRFNLWANESTGHITFPVRSIFPVLLVPPGTHAPASMFIGAGLDAPLGLYTIRIEAVSDDGKIRLARDLPVRVEPGLDDELAVGALRLEASHDGSTVPAGSLVDIPVELTIEGSWSRWVALFVEGPHGTVAPKRVVVEPGTPTRAMFPVRLARAAPEGALDVTIRAETEAGIGLIARDTARLAVGPPDPFSADFSALGNVTAKGSPERIALIPGSEGSILVTVRNTGGDALSVTLAASADVPLALDDHQRHLLPGEAFAVAMTVGPVPLDATVGLEVPLYVEVGLPGGGRDPQVFPVATLVVHDPDTPLPDDTLRASVDGPASPFEDPVVVAGAAVGGVGLVGWLAILLRRDAWRYLFMAPFAGLYTRLARKEVLDHATRDRIHAAIVARPGVHYSQLLGDMGLPAGVLIHHLRTLERHAYVRSRREGPYRRFYPAGARLPAVEADPMTPMQRRVLDILEASGPLTQAQLGERLGMTKQGVSYHLKGLARRGEVVAEDGPGALAWRRIAKVVPVDHQRP
ncbi:MAG TPA: MarR family transcriptional regulator [Candidatus Thermoplasmatota archaeon]|nr:MarR family transcriptional regulator [Candidatus Thermoplasmatota archaeon]